MLSLWHQPLGAEAPLHSLSRVLAKMQINVHSSAEEMVAASISLLMTRAQWPLDGPASNIVDTLLMAGKYPSFLS